jgi:hypothetical protein
LCRAFGAHAQQQLHPGLAAGPTIYRAFGPRNDHYQIPTTSFWKPSKRWDKYMRINNGSGKFQLIWTALDFSRHMLEWIKPSA